MAHYLSISFFEIIYSVKCKRSVLFSSRTFPKLMSFYQDALPIDSPNAVQFNFNYFENVLLTDSWNLTITLNNRCKTFLIPIFSNEPSESFGSLSCTICTTLIKQFKTLTSYNFYVHINWTFFHSHFYTKSYAECGNDLILFHFLTNFVYIIVNN